MKEQDPIESLFEKLQSDFDYELPADGHQERFLSKLQQANGVVGIHKKKNSWWKPLSIAASIALLAVLGVQLFSSQPNIKEQVVEISPEVSQTEFYFASLVEEQIQLLKNEKSPENEQLVEDTLRQLQSLENDYEMLEEALVAGGDSKLILNAMITNFQTRIDLLKEVLTTIESIKNLKITDDANFTI